MKPHTCPVCSGNGLVPNGFYSQTLRTWSTTTVTPEMCKTCTGTGIVWEPEKGDDEWEKLLKMDFTITPQKPTT